MSGAPRGLQSFLLRGVGLLHRVECSVIAPLWWSDLCGGWVGLWGL